MFGIVVTQKYYAVEINLGTTVPGAGANVPFPNVPQLQNALIYGVEVFSNNELTTSSTGKTLVSVLTGLVATFYNKNFERVNLYPCYNLNTINRFGIIPAFDPFVIDWQKSFVKITSTASLNANESIVFGFHYADQQPAAFVRKPKR
jgi:hypothetical protein